MTDLMSRPILRVRPATPGPRRPLLLSCVLLAAWVAVGGLICCVLIAVAGWFAADTGSFGGAVRVGALSWLVGNGAGVHLGSISLTAIPLGLLAVFAAVLYRGGRWVGTNAAVSSLADVTRGALVVGGCYAVAAAVTWLLTRADDAGADLARALVACFLVGVVFGGLGILHGAGRGAQLMDLLPDELRAALTGGLAGGLALMAAGALLVAGSLVVHFSTAVKLTEGLHSGLVGGAILALLGVAFAPNAVLCAGSFIAGPGFAVGSGTSVAPGDVHLGTLPSFPLLAALPSDASQWWQSALVALPVLAGALAGLVAVTCFPVFRLDHAALRGGCAGVVGGLGFAALTLLATGSVGPGRMADIGPDVAGTTVVCAVAFLLGGAVAGAGYRWLGEPRVRLKRSGG
ncbi:MAG: cell division protein PerM [Nocardioidaceae bacterium]